MTAAKGSVSRHREQYTTGSSLTGILSAIFTTCGRLKWQGWIIAIILITFGVISRKPDLISNPQFFGDESTWYKQAYEDGAFQTLFTNQAGYLILGSRLPSLVTVHAGFSEGPRIYLLYTVALEVVCISFLLTSRLSGTADLRSRMLLALLWIALPNSEEINTLNCTQWPLAVLGALFLLSDKPRTVLWRVVDLLAMFIIALTGPFCIFLLPIGLILFAARRFRNRWTLVLTGILAFGCVVQGWTLSHHLEQCRPQAIQVTSALEVITAQVFLFGAAHDGWTVLFAPLGSPTATRFSILIVVCGMALITYAMLKGTLSLRTFIAYGFLVLLACGNRLHCSAGWLWDALLLSPAYGARYWYIERLALLALFVWMLSAARPTAIRLAGATAIALVLIVSVRNWTYPPSPDLHFSQYATAFEQSPKGTLMTIPINPGWKLVMLKH